jgi:RNA polymerase sigma-70 factor, ECF subfamily
MTRSSIASRDARSRQAVPDAGFGRALRVPDPESLQWVIALRSEAEPRHRAIARLHGLPLRAAGFEVARRRTGSAHLGAEASGDIALQAAADALVGVLTRLDDYRGQSRFTTWAYKFALLEAAVAVRQKAWQGRELQVSDGPWSSTGAGASAHGPAGLREVLAALQEAIRSVLSDRQREVLTALALDGVSIDVLAERRATTRGALYTSLHEARRALRAELRRHGLDLSAGDED